MKWISLKIILLPSIIEEIDQVTEKYMNLMTEIKNFPECEKLTNKFILLRENIEKRVRDLEIFYQEKIIDPRVSYFEKVHVRLKKLLTYDLDFIINLKNNTNYQTNQNIQTNNLTTENLNSPKKTSLYTRPNQNIQTNILTTENFNSPKKNSLNTRPNQNFQTNNLTTENFNSPRKPTSNMQTNQNIQTNNLTTENMNSPKKAISNVQINNNIQTNNFTTENQLNLNKKVSIKSNLENKSLKITSKYSNEGNNNLKKINWIEKQNTFQQKGKAAEKNFEIFKFPDLKSKDEEEFQLKMISSAGGFLKELNKFKDLYFKIKLTEAEYKILQKEKLIKNTGKENK